MYLKRPDSVMVLVAVNQNENCVQILQIPQSDDVLSELCPFRK